MPPRWRCPDCAAAYGAWLSECPRCRSSKELVAVLNECASCTTRFAVGLLSCPHCGSTDFAEQGEAMGKITRLGGPSIAGAQVTGGAWSEGARDDKEQPARMQGEAGPELVDMSPGAVVHAHDPEGGEEPSPGNSSLPSSEKPPTQPEPKPPTPRKRARTTASRSRKAPTGASTAPSTGGAQTAPTSAADSD